VVTTIQQVLILDGAAGYRTVDVRLEGEKIVAIAPFLPPQGTLIDGRNKLLLPGFVNAHTHSSEMWQRGLIAPLPLELWLAELHDTSPTEPEQIYLSALGTAVETLLTGGTTVVDHLAMIPGREDESIEAAVRGYREAGIRAFVGPLIQDQSLETGMPIGQRHTPKTDPQVTAEVLAMMERAIAAHHDPAHGISIMTAPTGMQLCSDALFEGCIELSDRHSLCRHTHLLETKAQQMLALEKYGYSAVEHLKRIGFLGARTSLAHCVWLTDADIPFLADTQSTVVHNPLSNLRLGSGIAPLFKYREAGVNVTFGCDGAASNDSQDMLEAIKIGSILHCPTDFEYRRWITPRDAIQMASLGGVTGLGLGDQLGAIAEGKTADLVLYDLTDLSLLPRTDPIGLLVLGRPNQVVHHAWVNGKTVVADGKMATVDVAHLKQKLSEHSQWDVVSAATPRPRHALHRMEPQYRQVMGLE
jgi:cytosine/adenosine deaminase-related metal-dependent hydrolase